MPQSTSAISSIPYLINILSASTSLIGNFIVVCILLVASSLAIAQEEPYTLNVGYCEAVTTKGNNEIYLSFVAKAVNALNDFDYEFRLHEKNSGSELEKQAKVTVLQAPSHGRLKNGVYLPSNAYKGLDKVVVLVKFDQYQVKLTNELHIVNEYLSDDASDIICEKTGTSYPLSALPHPPPKRYDAIVKKTIFVTPQDTEKPQLKLAVGDIVYYTQVRKNEVLLTDLSLIPIAWIPSSLLIQTKVFRPLTQWTGQSHVTYCMDPVCEGQGAEYEFHKNGSYSLPKQSKSLGKLLRYQNYIWARTTDSSTSGMLLNLYKIQSDGKLCAVLADTGEQSNLMETQENQQCHSSLENPGAR